MTIQEITSQAPTEDEMAQVRTIFERAANAIVQASELSRVVSDLERRVQAMTADLDELRRRNQDLDERLAHIRTQRDDAEANLAKARDELAQTARERDHLAHTSRDDADTISGLRAKVQELTKDRDEATLKSMEAEEKLSTVQGQVDKLRSMARDAFGFHEPPPPAPAPEPVKPSWDNTGQQYPAEPQPVAVNDPSRW